PVADGYTVATTLNTLNVPGASLEAIPVRWWDAFIGTIEGSMGETSVVAALIGAAILITVGVGSWRIMLSCTLGLLGTSALMMAVSGPLGIESAMWKLPPWWHLVLGGFAFGAVWMATDPVS